MCLFIPYVLDTPIAAYISQEEVMYISYNFMVYIT